MVPSSIMFKNDASLLDHFSDYNAVNIDSEKGVLKLETFLNEWHLNFEVASAALVVK
jgi:hypothetical protein